MGWETGTARNCCYIIVFRFYSGPVRPLEHLDSHGGSVRRGDLDFSPGQSDTLDDMTAHTGCCAVPEQCRGDLVGVSWSGNLDPESGAAFLHVRRPDLHVQSTGTEERLTQRFQVLGTEVVHIGGEQDNISGFRRSRGDDQPESVGIARRVPSSCTPSARSGCSPVTRRRARREDPQERSTSWSRRLTSYRPG